MRKKLEPYIKYDEALAEALEEWEKLQDTPETHEEFLWREKELRDKISFAKAAAEEAAEEALEKGINQGKEQGVKQGIEQGIEQGVKQGIEQGIEQLIKKMYKNGAKIEEISKLTGINQKEIKEILKES